MTLEIAEYASPIGKIIIARRDGRICGLDFIERSPYRRQTLERRFGTVELRRAADPAGAVSRLAAYFAGSLDTLQHIAVDAGGSPFQRRVWRVLRRVPPGRTVSYGTIARAIGAPGAARAAAAANARTRSAS